MNEIKDEFFFQRIPENRRLTPSGIHGDDHITEEHPAHRGEPLAFHLAECQNIRSAVPVLELPVERAHFRV